METEPPKEDPVQYVSKYLEEVIASRRRYAHGDFLKLQVMSWSALAASFVSSILIASHLPPKLVLIPAFLAAVPGFLVAAESGLNYSKRNRMNEDAYLTYEHLLFRLRNGEDPKLIFGEFIEYSRRFAQDFPVGAVLPTISSPPETLKQSSETEKTEVRDD